VNIIRLNAPITTFGHNVHMPHKYPFTLRQVDQARTEFAATWEEAEATPTGAEGAAEAEGG
jgi:hypothetical protein